eukprot:COSAG01_NODE_2440_length_7691_cov_12.311249_7_plen_144_part_00
MITTVCMQDLVRHPLLNHSPALSHFPEKRGQDAGPALCDMHSGVHNFTVFEEGEFNQGEGLPEWVNDLGIQEVEIGLPADILKAGIELVDAPGLNQDATGSQLLRAAMQDERSTVLIIANAQTGITDLVSEWRLLALPPAARC